MRRSFYILISFLFLQISAKAQWRLIDSIDGANYINVHFWDANNGIISGETQGRFLKTYNGGLSWDTIAVPILVGFDYLSDMQFINNKIGFVCGGSGFSTVKSLLIGTKDAGLTWDSLIFNLPGAMEFTGLYFNSPDGISIKGIVYSYNTMFKSLDSGKTLLPVDLPGTGYFEVNAAVLWNTTIILSGRLSPAHTSSIYTSSDWGLTWKTVFSDTIAPISFGVKGSTIFAGTGYGYALRSVDGGNTWTKNKVASTNEYFKKVKFDNNGYVYLLGQSHLYGSADNGITWRSSLIDTPNIGFWDFSMPSKDTGYTISNRRLYKTTTGGGLALSVTNLSPTQDDIIIYPTPTNTLLHINVPTTINVKSINIYDATGRLVKQANSGWQDIDVTSFPKGMYIIEISTSGYISKKKLLVR